MIHNIIYIRLFQKLFPIFFYKTFKSVILYIFEIRNIKNLIQLYINDINPSNDESYFIWLFLLVYQNMVAIDPKMKKPKIRLLKF